MEASGGYISGWQSVGKLFFRMTNFLCVLSMLVPNLGKDLENGRQKLLLCSFSNGALKIGRTTLSFEKDQLNRPLKDRAECP
jgi:hypothetical protein